MDGLLTCDGVFVSRDKESHYDLIRRVYSDNGQGIDLILKSKKAIIFIEHFDLGFSRNESADSVIGLDYITENQINYLRENMHALTIRQRFLLNKALIKKNIMPLDNIYSDKKCLNCIGYGNLDEFLNHVQKKMPVNCMECLHKGSDING